MTILVFGQTGQVATELGQFPGVVTLARDQADLSDVAQCAAVIFEHSRNHGLSAVINAAAYTAVDRAESEEERATVINGKAPGAMARACAALDIPFVHISTDYVFNGEGTRPWTPQDTPAPQNAYGRSKLAGEVAVRSAGGRFAVLRTSWVFSGHGDNFVRTMLRLSLTRESLSVVNDQLGGPTPARAIAAACLTIARQLEQNSAPSGIYHLSGAPDISWYGFAKEIFAQSNRTAIVRPIATSEYPTAAPRPLNSRLDCSLTEKIFNLPRPDWRAALTEILQDQEHLN